MATNCQAIAATTGEQCENDATDGDFCGITSHHAGNATVEDYDGEDTAEPDKSGTPNRDENRFTEDWCRVNAALIFNLSGTEPRDGESVADSAGRIIAKKHMDGNAEAFRTVFGECATEGCERGCNGFDTDYCAKSGHEPAETEETTEGGEETITVEIDGHEVTGKKSEVMDLLN